VYGDFSTHWYVYAAADVLHQLEAKSGGPALLKNLDRFVSHVPFPKQQLYFVTALLVHDMKHNNPELYEQMQSRPEVGRNPAEKWGGYSGLIDAKLSLFNNPKSGGPMRSEQELIKHIGEDPDIKAAWDWLTKKIAKQPEYKKFVERLHLNDGLRFNAETGNSYSAAMFVNLAGTLDALAKDKGEIGTKRGIMIGYGSGAQTTAMEFETVEGIQNSAANNLSVDLSVKNKLGKISEYRMIWEALLEGEAKRMAPDSLAEMDRKLLDGPNLAAGFHIEGRNDDGTKRKAWHIDGEGTLTEVFMRH